MNGALTKDAASPPLFACCSIGLSWAEGREAWARRMVILAGAVIGALAVALSYFGNPANTGICISCFLETSAGALGLHGNERMHYLRPELIGFVLGAFAMARRTGEFAARGGSSPIIRFIVGVFLIVGCAVFMGCPIKMILRLAAGDLSAVAGVAGLVAGVAAGIVYFKKGFSLGPQPNVAAANGYVVPALAAMLLLLLLAEPAFLRYSGKGAGGSHAPLAMSLAAGLAIGAIAQRSHFCVTGGIGNILVARDFTMFQGIASMFVTAMAVSMLTGQFNAGLLDQPGSHLDYGWSFAGLFLVGLGSVLAGGCPFRQMVLAGSGNVDSGFTLMGMLAGAAFVQNWQMGGTSAGVLFNGKIAVLAGLVFMAALGLTFRKREGGAA